MAVITINGREFPAPDVGGNLVVATNVSSGKNANGEFVGQKVGRDQYKFDALQWKFLDAATWSAMLQEFDKFVVTARIPDMVNNRSACIRETVQPRRSNLMDQGFLQSTGTVRSTS